MTDFDRRRRKLLQAGGAALTLGLAGCVGPFQDGQGVPGTVGEAPDGHPRNNKGGNGNGGGNVVDQYLSDANGYDSVQDMTGQSEVTVEVGAGQGLAFGPAAIQVDPGTTVTWEWTGQGGAHNVIDEDGKFESDLVSEEGHTFTYTFEEEAVTRYYCQPHKGVGMRGAVVVGDSLGGGGGGVPSEVSDYLSDANEYNGVEDMTGQSEVTVQVGAGQGLAFGPAAIQVDPGTTVTWEWTGQGGAHNVIDEDGKFESDLVSEEGHTFSYTFEEEGITQYYCQPHKGVGMRGAVVVGSTGGGGGGGGGGGVPSAVQDYLSDVPNYDSVQDMTGQGEVTVEVGAGQGLAFAPPAIRVDSGTTVTWEWTGQGGSHNVIDEDGKFESELVGDSGHTFTYTFEEAGATRYYCQPHKGVGMKGAVIVE
jgi:halocyanin-like protein